MYKLRAKTASGPSPREDMASFEGLGHAIRDLASTIQHPSTLLLGRPKMMRPIGVDEPYTKERKMTWSELFFDLIFVTGSARWATCSAQA